MSKKVKLIQIVYISSLFLLISCRPEPKVQIPESHYNILVLLDLSDRLITQTDQCDRDKKIIKQIWDIVEKNIKNDIYIKSSDIFKIKIADQDESLLGDDELHFENNLILDLSDKAKRIQNKKSTDLFKLNLPKYLDTLYLKSVSKDPKKYMGAKISEYINDDLENDLKNDKGYINYMIIITDGEMVVENKYRGFPLGNKKFNNKILRVAIIEIDDSKDEFNNLKTKWGNWLFSHGIQDWYFQKRKADSDIMSDLRRFIIDEDRSPYLIKKSSLADPIKKTKSPNHLVSNISIKCKEVIENNKNEVTNNNIIKLNDSEFLDRFFTHIVYNEPTYDDVVRTLNILELDFPLENQPLICSGKSKLLKAAYFHGIKYSDNLSNKFKKQCP